MKTKSLLFLILQYCISSTAYGALPPDFIAYFNVDKFGTTVGRSKIALSRSETEMHYSQDVELTGFVSLFKKDRVSEDSLLTKLDDKTLQFKSYRYVHKHSDKNRDSSFAAQWTTAENTKRQGTITGHTRGETVSLTTDEPLWDTLSFQLALIDDVSNGKKSYHYNVISRGEIKQYTFAYIGEEKIEIDDKEYNAIKLIRQSGDKTTKIWLAPSLHYTPVLIEQYKEDDLDSTMTLDSITFNNSAEDEAQDK